MLGEGGMRGSLSELEERVRKQALVKKSRFA